MVERVRRQSVRGRAVTLAGKTLLITGASRGIGLAIARRAARDGANIILAAKTQRPHPLHEDTIHSAAQEIERLGGHALPVAMDLRYEDQIQAGVEAGVAAFGGIDILIHNAAALLREPTERTTTRRFDLLFEVNVRGNWLMTKACLPHLRNAANPHVLSIAPPLGVPAPADFGAAPAFAIAKYNASLMIMAFAREFAAQGIAFNALWPRVAIWTPANEALHGLANRPRSRRPEAMADAAWHMLTRDAAGFTGNFMLDEDVLRQAGIADLAPYLYPGADPADMFLSTLFSHAPGRHS